MGVGWERSGQEWHVPIPSVGTRDVTQGEVGVRTPKYPHKAPGTMLPSNPVQGAGRPRHISLTSSQTSPSNSFVWDVYVGWSGSLEPGWDRGTWQWMHPLTQA